ncbi:hypothetical protein U8527_13550 [Kordia algicida OT-1]|uniref:Uncharacterized protein n=1 Tax=Kordia algicida OT-1 TaxID=391587 RepID=A9DWP6_9FLAO|nr:hypothetical protein [Kordia algicida]EDP95922.1 hypothetical protein KAOT1_07133 [Kordia algicida OT-1]
MKKIITTIILLVATIGFAQNKDTKDAVLKEITNEVCECVSAKTAEGLTADEVEVQLGLCMMSSYGKYKKRLDKFMIVSLDDSASLEKLGQEIGFKMLEICPDTFMVFAKDLVQEELDNENSQPVVSDNTTMVFGEIVKLTKEQFNIVTFKANNKRTYKLLWMEYFEGQELLDDVKQLKNQRVKVSYENKEMYDPKLKDYRTYKVLRKIEAVN